MTEDFSADYFDARERFLSLALARGFMCESHPIEAKGPKGEPLVVDVALSPHALSAPATVIVTSGLHGVEGYLGSAIQLAVLRDFQPSDRCGLALIHALNPFGFAHGRRVNETNVDLNRAFLPETAFSGCSEGYAELNGFLNPTHPDPSADFFTETFRSLIKKMGEPALKQAIAKGQYVYPAGLFYGGRTRSRTFTILEDNLSRWVGRATRLIHIDIHTGLGDRGTHALLASGSCMTSQYARFASAVPIPGTIQPLTPTGVAYEVSGGLGDWLCARLRNRVACESFAAEFGTESLPHVAQALRDENRAFHHGDEQTLRSARARLTEVFAPADADWRRRTQADGVRIVHAAVNALSEPVGSLTTQDFGRIGRAYLYFELHTDETKKSVEDYRKGVVRHFADGLPNPLRILDYGCGAGVFLERFLRKVLPFNEVELILDLVDPNDEGREAAVKRMQPFSASLRDARRLCDLDLHTCDIVLAHHSLYYVPEDQLRPDLELMLERLAPHGIFIASLGTRKNKLGALWPHFFARSREPLRRDADHRPATWRNVPHNTAEDVDRALKSVCAVRDLRLKARRCGSTTAFPNTVSARAQILTFLFASHLEAATAMMQELDHELTRLGDAEDGQLVLDNRKADRLFIVRR